MKTETNEATPREKMLALMEAHKITVDAVFVPWTKSRKWHENATKTTDRSLNWRITLMREGRRVLATDYTAGIAHCPAYNDKRLGAGLTVDKANAICRECETGKSRNGFGSAILPDSVDVLWSLVQESSVLDYARFEDWAPDLGYDPDSRKDEALYRVCMEIALQLRSGLGDALLQELREAGQDY